MRGIRTDRLVLREPTMADLPAMVAVHTDPGATVFEPEGPRTPEQCHVQLTNWIQRWATDGHCYWIILTDGGPIGFGGIGLCERDGEPYLNLYFRFTPSAWGHGYATEMATAALDLAARRRPDLPVWIVTAAENQRALRIAEKFGFHPIPSPDPDDAFWVYREWRAPTRPRAATTAKVITTDGS
ncbi:GNAT family N-acetyltransferase [Actinokineospora sp. HUAS TT18]|uniref:GNAT family N-acetyltransferase n=1 Tax=Actinokineospora sp. HUAS TT18 TaxID=3447451 RepID=UPI003F524518